MQLRRLSSVFFIAIVIALVVAACGSGEEATSTPVPTTPPTTAPTTAPTRPGATAGQPTATPAATATARPTTPPQPTATPVRVSSGELKIAEVNLRNFDMLLTGGGIRYYLDPLYDHMIGTDNAGKLDPTTGYATQWTVSADLRTWTWKLRNDVVFHTGDKATAKDLKFTFENWIATGMPASQAAAIKAEIASIEIPDATTFVAKLTAPRLLWQYKFSRGGSSGELPYLYPETYWKSVGDKVFNQKPVGSGPYKFKSLVIGDRINYEAVEKHWYTGVPRTKNLTFLVVGEENTRIALLKNGDVDLAPISKASAKTLRGGTIRVLLRDGSAYTSNGIEDKDRLEIPGYGKNPLSDVRVRQAVAWYAIDRKAIVDSFMAGLGTPAAHGQSSSEIAQADLPATPPYDPAKAKQLLAAAGYPDGFEMEFYTWFQANLGEGGEINEALATMWEAIGIKVLRNPLALATWRQNKVANKEYTKPTIVGMYFLGSLKPDRSGDAATNNDPKNLFSSSKDATLDRLGKAWAGAATMEEYLQRGKEYKLAEYNSVPSVVVFSSGESFAAGPKVPEKWQLGKGSFSYQYEYMAGLWY